MAEDWTTSTAAAGDGSRRTRGGQQSLPSSIRIPVIKGEMLTLRPARLEDLAAMDALDAYYGSSTITGRSRQAERNIVDSWVRDSVAWSLGDVDVEATLFAHGLTRTIAWTMLSKLPVGAEDGELSPIGMVFLTQVDSWVYSARIQVILGRDFRGRGYSRDAMPRVMTYGFASAPVGLNLHRVWVSVPEKNTRAISVYQSLGFTIEGTLRDALWDEENEKYQDQVVMGTMADEYDPVRALDNFGMRMNPENPGVKEALAAHEHSIEIVQQSHSAPTGEIPQVVPRADDERSGRAGSRRAWWRKIGRSQEDSSEDGEGGGPATPDAMDSIDGMWSAKSTAVVHDELEGGDVKDDDGKGKRRRSER